MRVGKVQPGRASLAPHPPSMTQLASFDVATGMAHGVGGGPSGGDFSALSAPRSEVLILFPSPSVGLSFKLELISHCPAQPHQEKADRQGNRLPSEGCALGRGGLSLDAIHTQTQKPASALAGGLSVQCCHFSFLPTGAGPPWQGGAGGPRGDPLSANPTQPA